MEKLLIIFCIIWTSHSSLLSQIDTVYQEEKTVTLKDNKEEEVFTIVEDMPVFVESCLNAKYLQKCNMMSIRNYLEKASESIDYDGVKKGKVYISFVVEIDGSVTQVKVVRADSEELESLALKHIQNMPKFFIPGKQRGNAVRVKYNVPVVF